MDIMKDVLKKKRMKLAGDMMDDGNDDSSDINAGDDVSGLMDKKQAVGNMDKNSELAPSIEATAEDPSEVPDDEMMEQAGNDQMDQAITSDEDKKKLLESLLEKDDIGKPGMKGKIAAGIMSALSAMSVTK